MQYATTTFAHGNGPYSRIIDLGLAINDELKKRNFPKMSFLIPLVYGEKQREIMLQQFEQVLKGEPYILLLDETYGQFLGESFFKTGPYEKNLRHLIQNYSKLEERIRNHLNGNFRVKTFDGKEVKVNGNDIEFEISHNPRVATGYKKSFYTTIALFSEILERTSREPSLKFDRNVLEEARKIAKRIEEDRIIHFIPEPFTFSYDESRIKREREIFTPPFIHPPKPDTRDLKKGMYVMVTGIEGLKELFSAVSEFGIKLYCSPNINLENADNSFNTRIVSNPNIQYQFARTGLSSVWLSHMTETPLITPPYTEGDDPEIYFNEKTVKKLGIATLFDKERNPQEILREADNQKESMRKLNRKLMKNYGTIDGMDYTAKIIVDFLEGKNISPYKEISPALS